MISRSTIAAAARVIEYAAARPTPLRAGLMAPGSGAAARMNHDAAHAETFRLTHELIRIPGGPALSTHSHPTHLTRPDLRTR